MSHLVDYAVWKEHLARQQRMDHHRLKEVTTTEKDKPFSGNAPYFTRGWAHNFYNDSSKVRMLLRPEASAPGNSIAEKAEAFRPREGSLSARHEEPSRLKLPAVRGTSTPQATPRRDLGREYYCPPP
ncbi:unnamed protein product [Effrenium voratum]|nr:unnamed protein product [Effrenium voratum]